MTLRISGKSINVGEALRGRVSERTDEVLRKYFDGNYSGHITLSKDGFGFRTDCSLHLDSGITLEADSNAADAYASADQALLSGTNLPPPMTSSASSAGSYWPAKAGSFSGGVMTVVEGLKPMSTLSGRRCSVTLMR